MNPIPSTDPVESAHAAGLRYVTGTGPGIIRKKRASGFLYFDSAGKQVRDEATLDRIRSLVIPPAWENVWICPSPNGHLQAIGRDARGRKQYRYHPRYREVRNLTKFDRMLIFGKALPKVRRAIAKDLRVPGMPKRKVLAAIVRLLDETRIRIGNDEYAKSNDSYGLTTLKNRHARVIGDKIRFHFRGKSGQEADLTLRDPVLARIVRRCQDLPGEELFQYRTESGELQAIDSADVNEYLREISGEEITAKDFRTWHGTTHMLATLHALGPSQSETAAKKTLAEAVKATALMLGNRPATCRSYYIHPAVIEGYLKNTIFEASALDVNSIQGAALRRREEAAVFQLIRRFIRAGRAATRVRKMPRPAAVPETRLSLAS